MKLLVVLCLFLNLQAFQAEPYICKNNEYPAITKTWKDVIDPYCKNLDESLTGVFTDCINKENVLLPDALKKCQALFNRPAVSIVKFLQDFCVAPLEVTELFVCCLTDMVLKAGADTEALKRASAYKKCLGQYVKNGP